MLPKSAHLPTILIAVVLVLLAVLTATGQVKLGAALLIAAVQIGCIGWLGGLALAKQRTASVDLAQPASAAVPQEFLERIPDPVIVLNAAREIITVNRAARETLGIGLLGRDLALSLRHPDVLAAVETVASGLPSVTEEITLPMPIPRTFTLHAGTLHSDGLPTATDPQLPRVVLVLRDETRARRAEQSRADFVANASHELRSPLSALIGFIETLRGPASDDAIARDRFLGVMHAEAQRMARLVEDLMSLTRVEINEHIPPRHRVELADVLIGVTETLVVRAEKRQMTITLDCPDDLPLVMGETDQLTQVFHNLIDNAVKYARAGTSIRITARAVERLPSTQTAGVKISVTDAGEGIPAIHLPRLTERFYRADEGRSRRLGGTGLGLAIVKHIVNRHRGRLSIDSIVGEGSTFTVFLPALPRPIASPNGGDGDDDSWSDPASVTKL